MRNVFRYVVVAGLYTVLAVPAAAQQPQPQPQQNPDRITVPFSDPARPGSLKVKLLQGNIVIKGVNRRDVMIQGGPGTDLARNRAVEPPPGLRRLTQPAGFSVVEDDNEMSVSATSFNRSFDLQIEVPLKTNLDLSMMNGRGISVEDVEGELEISNLNGAIALRNVAGSVVAHSMNGSVTAVVTRATPQAPMAFTSMNGTVDVTLPAAIKANLKLRSDQGDVFTDFDLQLNPAGSQTNTTNAAPAPPTPPAPPPPFSFTPLTPLAPPTPRDRSGRFRIDFNRSIYGSINGGGPDVELRSFNGSVILRKGK